MDLYQLTFAVLVIASCGLAYAQHRSDLKSEECGGENADLSRAAKRFRWLFIPVYLLVMGSDWLQGPYVYTLYKDEKNLSEPVVAGLFTSGFLSAAVTATFVGSLADKHGRKLACLVFCVSYAIGCLTKIWDDVIILFLGRVLGGLSTTLMYSVFESWMVTEYHSRGLERSSMSLSTMFTIMMTLNSLVAIASGVVGEGLVALTGTKVSPFMAAIVCLAMSYWFINRYWGENYGDSAALTPDVPEKSTFKIIFKDKRIPVLGFVVCCFEGSMYIFVFFWSAAMKAAHSLKYSQSASATKTVVEDTEAANIPFGLIFASFMASIMLGSLAFGRVIAAANATANGSSPSNSLQAGLLKTFTSANMLTLSISISAISLLLVVLIKDEAITFWCFCLFEACIGIYFPTIGAQKGKIVEDGVRAKVYGLIRIPLNIFVVLVLTLTVEGEQYRDRVFTFCGGLLLLAALASGYYLHDDPPFQGKSESDEEAVDGGRRIE